MATLGADQLQRRGMRALIYYTTWSWWLLTGFFGVAALASARRVHRDGRRKKGAENGGQSAKPLTTTTAIPLLDAAAVALLHVALPTSLIVVALTWALLVPMHISSPDKARTAFARAMFFNFASYCQHGFNALFALGDVFLSQIPILPYLSGALLLLYSSVFGVGPSRSAGSGSGSTRS